MRRWRVVIVTVLGCVLVAGTAAAASDEAEAPDPFARQEEVVALVLDQDARFADALDYAHGRKGRDGTPLEIGKGRIVREGPFRNLWVQPAAGDGVEGVLEIAVVKLR